MQCRCVIISHTGIGYKTNRDIKSTRRPHHIKAEYKSLCNVSSIFNNAKCLKKDKYYTGVNVNKRLSREELNYLERMRQQGIDLNKAHSVDANGRKPFIAISEKLMKRDKYGKLQAFSSAPVSFQPKNA